MPLLLDGVTADSVSSPVIASGPVLVAVVGKIPYGMVKITADIGIGEAVAYTFNAGDETSLARLELASGVSFKAYLIGTNGHVDTDVTVGYLNV